MGCHSLLQEIFPTQGLNLLLLCLLHCRLILYPLSQMIYQSTILNIFAYFASFNQQFMRLVPQYFSFYRKQKKVTCRMRFYLHCWKGIYLHIFPNWFLKYLTQSSWKSLNKESSLLYKVHIFCKWLSLWKVLKNVHPVLKSPLILYTFRYLTNLLQCACIAEF